MDQYIVVVQLSLQNIPFEVTFLKNKLRFLYVYANQNIIYFIILK